MDATGGDCARWIRRGRDAVEGGADADLARQSPRQVQGRSNRMRRPASSSQSNGRDQEREPPASPRLSPLLPPMSGKPTRPGQAAPLYAFSVPPALLSNFKPRQITIPEHHPLHPSKKELPPIEPAPASSNTLAIGGAFTCALTGASFPDLASLREHYKTDWYKYNVKLRLQGKPTGVTEDQFNALVEGTNVLG